MVSSGWGTPLMGGRVHARGWVYPLFLPKMLMEGRSSTSRKLHGGLLSCGTGTGTWVRECGCVSHQHTCCARSTRQTQVLFDPPRSEMVLEEGTEWGECPPLARSRPAGKGRAGR